MTTYKCENCSHEPILSSRPRECEICGGDLVVLEDPHPAVKTVAPRTTTDKPIFKEYKPKVHDKTTRKPPIIKRKSVPRWAIILGAAGLIISVVAKPIVSWLKELQREGTDEKIEWKRHDSINQGNNTNRLRIVTQGNLVTGFINDKMVGDFKDDSYESGEVGVWSGSNGVAVNFDKINVTVTLFPILGIQIKS